MWLFGKRKLQTYCLLIELDGVAQYVYADARDRGEAMMAIKQEYANQGLKIISCSYGEN